MKVSFPSNNASSVVWIEMVLDVSPGAKVNFEQGEIEGRQDRVADPALGCQASTDAEDGANLSAPGGRQPAEPVREDHDQHRAQSEIRQAKAED